MQRPITRLAAVCLTVCLVGLLSGPVLISPPRDWLRVSVGLLILCAAISPRTSLLLLAAFVPLATVIVGFLQIQLRSLDLLVLACATGWSIRYAIRSREPGVPSELRQPLLLLAAVTILSGLVMVIALRELIGPEHFREQFVRSTLRNFFADRGRFEILKGVVLVLETLAVMCAAIVATNESPSVQGALVRTLTAGATGAAALNLARVLEIALRSPSLAMAWETIRTVRVNTAYGDVNAAGSFFAMSAILAFVSVHHARGRWKAVPSIAAALLMFATWLTGSRAAVAAMLLACLGLLIVRYRRGAGPRTLAAGLILCVAAAGAFATVFPNPLTGNATTVAMLVRQEMARISIKMLMVEPFFGVGIGRFYAASGSWLDASPLAAYYRNENAHNTVLQWTAESGLVGAVAAAWLLFAILRIARRHARTGRAPSFDYLAAALLVFTVSALFGHPLLTPEVSLSAGLVVGLFVGTAHIREAAQHEPRYGFLAVALLTLLACTPWRVAREMAQAPLEQMAWGVSGWQTDAAGEKFRRMSGPATLFIPTRSGWAEVPYRLSEGGEPLVLVLTFRGRTADRLIVADHEWHRYVIRIVPSKGSPQYEPLEIRVVEGTESRVLLGKVSSRGSS